MAFTQYELSRSYWDFAFENTDKVKPTHAAIFFFAIEHCNRLGWKDRFGLPTSMVVEAIGNLSYNTFKPHFDDLVEWGFIKVIAYSKNQYSSNVIALSTAVSKSAKALDKALIKHSTKHLQSNLESTGSIDKPIYNKPIYKEQIPASLEFETFWKAYKKPVDKKKCLQKFSKLKKSDVEKILIVVDDYVLSTPDAQYRKNPATWLNGECWNDEIKNASNKTGSDYVYTEKDFD